MPGYEGERGASQDEGAYASECAGGVGGKSMPGDWAAWGRSLESRCSLPEDI